MPRTRFRLTRLIWTLSAAATLLLLALSGFFMARGTILMVRSRTDGMLEEYAARTTDLINLRLASLAPGSLTADAVPLVLRLPPTRDIQVQVTDPGHAVALTTDPALTNRTLPDDVYARTGVAVHRRASSGLESIVTMPLSVPGWHLVARQPLRSPAMFMMDLARQVWIESVVLLALAALVMAFLVRFLQRAVVAPLAGLENVVTRVAQGDLSVQLNDDLNSSHEVSQLVRGVGFMVVELRTLAQSIQSASTDAATLAMQISASTQQMSASTEEVAGTCGDLTDRANRQAALVRATADDASRILAIAKELAQGAQEAAERNAALARLARSHKEQLDASSAQLDRLAGEIELGADEAEALTTASEEIEKFVIQTKAIARQTHMLALNAGIEAARAGAEGRGFAVVAEEVRKLSGQAAQSATNTSQTVEVVQSRVRTARERLLRLAQGGVAARDAATTAAQGLGRVASEAEANDSWTQSISGSAGEVSSLVEGIADRMGAITEGTEEFAAAAQEIAASAEELSASTVEIAHSATQLSEASGQLTGAVRRFRVRDGD